MAAAFLYFVVFALLAQMANSYITGRLTCDNIVTFYADGIQKVPPANPTGSDSNWRVPSKVTIPSTTRVYAIKCRDLHVVGGIVASFSNGIVTDGSWKCTTRYYRSWYSVGFNDDSWSAAYVIGTYGTKYPWLDVPKVGTGYGAKWIWTRGWQGSHKTVYCRKTVITGKVTCDNIVTFYADGIQNVPPANPTGSDTNWQVSSEVAIPSSTKVYAIKCKDEGWWGGIVASFSNGIVTDGSWKCTTRYYRSWYSVRFNDNSWPAAYVIGTYGATKPWLDVPKVGTGFGAKWIWTRGWQGSQKTVYCRKTVKPVITGNITCGDILTFYADGLKTVPPANPPESNTDWRVSSKVIISTNTKVYAIKCIDRGMTHMGGVGGIVASFSNGIVTDGSWKCTTQYYHSWYSVGFNDKNWLPAYVIGTYGTSFPWYDEPKVGTRFGAKWIWTRGWKFYDNIVYCRKVVR